MFNRLILTANLVMAIFAMGCGDGSQSSGEARFNLEDVEPNNKLTQAQRVTAGTIVKGFIDEKLDQDWYMISIPEDSAAILRATLKGISDINLKMELFDPDNEELLDVDCNKEGADEILTNFSLQPGQTYLRVRELWLKKYEKKFNDSLAYYLSIELDDVTDSVEQEPNNRAIEATKLLADVLVSGYISPYKDVDWYRLALPRGERQYLEITLTAIEDIDLKLTVFDPIEALIASADQGGKGEREKIANLGIDQEKDFYYVVVAGGAWQTNENQRYSLTARFVQTPHKVELEPNDRLVKATPLMSGDTLYGFIDTKDDADWYRIEKETFDTQIARIEVRGVPKIDFQLSVLNDLEETILSVNETGEQESERVTNIGLQRSMDYFIRLKNKRQTPNDSEQYFVTLQTRSFLGGEEFELNNNRQDANDIELEKAIAGYIHPIGDMDFYRLRLRNRISGRLEIILEGIMKVNTDMALYDDDMDQIATAQARSTEGIERITFDGDPGTYYIKVYDNDGKESNYRDKYTLAIFVKPS